MLLTFKSTQKKVASKLKGITVALRSDRDTFARILLIQKDRHINLKETLHCRWQMLMEHCQKQLNQSYLQLSKSIPQVTLLMENTVNIFDVMVLFQKLRSTLLTFGDIGDYLLQKIYKNPCRVAFFVTNFYMPFSIKSIERKQSSVMGSLRIKIANRNQQKPKCWNKYLLNSNNKIELVKFLIDYWSQDESSRELVSNRELYVTYEAKAFCIRTIRMQFQKVVVPGLQSEQEEADTKSKPSCKTISSLILKEMAGRKCTTP